LLPLFAYFMIFWRTELLVLDPALLRIARELASDIFTDQTIRIAASFACENSALSAK
jgi:hypothetical protein